MQYLIEQPDGTRVPITHEQYQQLVLTRSAYHVIRGERVEIVKKRERVSQYAHVAEWHRHLRSVGISSNPVDWHKSRRNV